MLLRWRISVQDLSLADPIAVILKSWKTDPSMILILPSEFFSCHDINTLYYWLDSAAGNILVMSCMLGNQCSNIHHCHYSWILLLRISSSLFPYSILPLLYRGHHEHDHILSSASPIDLSRFSTVSPDMWCVYGVTLLGWQQHLHGVIQDYSFGGWDSL